MTGETTTKEMPTVYVVDDDASVRKALKRLIKSAGFEVRTFASGKEFLNYAGAAASGCLVLDVRMPGMSGLELQRRLAESGACIPIIFITAHDDEPSRKQAFENGAVAFLPKPVGGESLLEAVQVALNR